MLFHTRRISFHYVLASYSVRLILCIDDWEVIKEDKITEVMSWMGDLGGISWFPGYLPLTIMKPCSKWSTIKMLKAFISFNPRAVCNVLLDILAINFNYFKHPLGRSLFSLAKNAGFRGLLSSRGGEYIVRTLPCGSAGNLADELYTGIPCRLLVKLVATEWWRMGWHVLCPRSL